MSTYDSQASGQVVVFFQEGPGAFYVRELGEGSFGTVSLVRFANTMDLAARKEDKLDDSIPKPENEVSIYQQLHRVDGIAKLLGWCKYEQFATGPTFTVEVDHYEKELNLPEKYVYSWVARLFETLTAIHAAGVAHRDLHGSNIYLHREHLTHEPTVSIGDFGAAMFSSHPNFRLECKTDYIRLAQVCLKLCRLTRSSTQMLEVRSFLNKLSSSTIDVVGNLPSLSVFCAELKTYHAGASEPNLELTRTIFDHTTNENDEPWAAYPADNDISELKTWQLATLCGDADHDSEPNADHRSIRLSRPAVQRHRAVLIASDGWDKTLLEAEPKHKYRPWSWFH